MGIIDLLNEQDAEIIRAASEVNATEIKVAELGKELTEKRKLLDDLRRERATLETMARRRGELPDIEPQEVLPQDSPIVLEWRAMNRLDAVERVLRESTVSRHINEIVAHLHGVGRFEDTYQLVSASLATLRNRRGNVRAVGNGRWVHQDLLPGQNTEVMNATARWEGYVMNAIDKMD